MSIYDAVIITNDDGIFNFFFFSFIKISFEHLSQRHILCVIISVNRIILYCIYLCSTLSITMRNIYAFICVLYHIMDAQSFLSDNDWMLKNLEKKTDRIKFFFWPHRSFCDTLAFTVQFDDDDTLMLNLIIVVVWI